LQAKKQVAKQKNYSNPPNQQLFSKNPEAKQALFHRVRRSKARRDSRTLRDIFSAIPKKR
jgi:hypothetical protein